MTVKAIEELKNRIVSEISEKELCLLVIRLTGLLEN